MKKNSPAKAASTAAQPSVDNPGKDLPAEITQTGAPRTAAERFNDWEEGKILDLLRNEFGGTGFVTLQRRHMSVAQGQWTNLAATIPVENLKDGGISLIASMFGGGDYRAKARPSNGQFARDFTFVIDHTIPPKNPLNTSAPKEEKGPDVASIVRTIVDATKLPAQDNSVLLAMMQQQTAVIQAAMARPEPKGEAAAMLQMIQQMREDQRKSEERMMKLFEKLSERAPAGGSDFDQMEKALAFVDRLEDLRGGKEGGSDKDKPWYADVAVELAKSAGPFLNKFAGGAPAIPGAPLLTAAASSAVTVPPASSTTEPLNVTGTANQPADSSADMTNPMLSIAIGSFRNSAIKAAKAAKDPYELVATSLGFVSDNFPQYLVAIRATANSADWFNQIFAQHSEASKHLKFLGEVRDAVLLNAFVAHAADSAAKKKTAAQTVQDFLSWVNPEFHDGLFTATDPDNWEIAFDGATLPESAPGAADGAALDPVWLGELRQAVIATLDLEQSEAEPEQPLAAAAPATSAANGAGPRAKSGAAAGKKTH